LSIQIAELAYITASLINENIIRLACRFFMSVRIYSAAASARAGLRSAESMTVAVACTLSSLGDRSFATAGPRAWNKLPSHLHLMQSADTFRRHLRTFLFHQAFLS